MSRNAYPFHLVPKVTHRDPLYVIDHEDESRPAVMSARSAMVLSMQKAARANARKRIWRNVGWMVATAIGTIAFTVFMYYRIGA